MTNSDYRGPHQGPSPDDGAPLYDVSEVMPDYYENPEWYATGDHDSDKPSRDAILRSYLHPSHKVVMFRAVPQDVSTINPGDWVTTSLRYANLHGMEGWHVLSAVVRADELYTDGNSINEWSYWPHEQEG